MTILQQKLLVGSRRSFLTPSDGGMSQELKNVHIRGPVIPHLGSISRKKIRTPGKDGHLKMFISTL